MLDCKGHASTLVRVLLDADDPFAIAVTVVRDRVQPDYISTAFPKIKSTKYSDGRREGKHIVVLVRRYRLLLLNNVRDGAADLLQNIFVNKKRGTNFLLSNKRKNLMLKEISIKEIQRAGAI